MAGDVLIYRDTDHLSEKGSLRMQGFFRDLLVEHLVNATVQAAGADVRDS